MFTKKDIFTAFLGAIFEIIICALAVVGLFSLLYLLAYASGCFHESITSESMNAFGEYLTDMFLRSILFPGLFIIPATIKINRRIEKFRQEINDRMNAYWNAQTINHNAVLSTIKDSANYLSNRQNSALGKHDF